MLFNPVVLVFSPERDDMGSFGGLCASGFECRYFSSQEALYTEVQGLTDVRGIAVILMGPSVENRRAIFYLRTIRAELGLVAQLRSGSEEEHMSLIQAGADWISPVGASHNLIATMLLSLWDRRMPIPRGQPSVAPLQCGEWSLTEHAWMLQGPTGERVSLTGSERALLVTLFDTPEWGASYEALTIAVNAAQNVDATTVPRRRLGVLVSRLRSKCGRRGMDLPIRVLQNRGYMFVGSAQADAGRRHEFA